MKKIISVIFLLNLFLFQFSVYAAIGDNFGDLPIPGETCGVATDTKINKCCNIKEEKAKPPRSGFIGTAIGEVTDFVSGLINPMQTKIQGDLLEDIQQQCVVGVPSTPSKLTDPKCICLEEPKSAIPSERIINKFCALTLEKERDACAKCITGDLGKEKTGIWTGVGCVKSDVKLFIQETILKTGVGIAGGISLLCIIFAAFQMQISQGNAEKIKKAQQLFTNCITGLMLIIFSVLILKIIGVDILRIPRFG